MPANVGNTLVLPRVIICEGIEDCSFFDCLIRERNLPKFHIRPTSLKKSLPGGNTKFGAALKTLKTVRGFDEVVKDIILVTDCDDEKSKSFQKICQQITESGVGNAPTNIGERSSSIPAITVLMLPANADEGALESLLNVSARASDSTNASKIDMFVSQVSSNFSLTRKDKVWLRCYLAAKAKDPFVSLTSVFEYSKNRHLIPLNHAIFDDLVEKLRSFGSVSAAPAVASGPGHAQRKPPSKKTHQKRTNPQTRPHRGRSQ